MKALVDMAAVELAGASQVPRGRFTNWVRFVKVDLECEGVTMRVPTSSPQRIRLTGAQ